MIRKQLELLVLLLAIVFILPGLATAQEPPAPKPVPGKCAAVEAYLTDIATIVAGEDSDGALFQKCIKGAGFVPLITPALENTCWKDNDDIKLAHSLAALIAGTQDPAVLRAYGVYLKILAETLRAAKYKTVAFNLSHTLSTLIHQGNSPIKTIFPPPVTGPADNAYFFLAILGDNITDYASRLEMKQVISNMKAQHKAAMKRKPVKEKELSFFATLTQMLRTWWVHLLALLILFLLFIYSRKIQHTRDKLRATDSQLQGTISVLTQLIGTMENVLGPLNSEEKETSDTLPKLNAEAIGIDIGGSGPPLLEPGAVEAPGEDGSGDDGFEQDGVEQDGVGQDGIEKDGVGQDGVGQDGVGQDGVGQDGVEQDGVEQDGVEQDGTRFFIPDVLNPVHLDHLQSGLATIGNSMTNLVEAMATLEQTGTQLKTHARENSQLLPGIYDSLGTLETSVDSHAGGIKRLEKELNDLQAKEAPPAKTETEEEVFLSVQMLNVERAILKDTWNMKALESPKKILYALLQAGENRTGAEALTGVNSGENAGVNVKALVHGCHRLGSLLKGNESLLTLHNRTFTPLRRYTETLEEFLEVCELLKESPVSPDDAADYSAKIAAFRLKIDFLLSLRDGEVVHRLVSFRVRVWVSEEFLEFADRYLREYGRAVLAETLSENQKEVANLVNEILEYGDLRPVPILLGETYFDSNQHIGRSHTKESSMKNGTIAEVVKSGFETLAGETVQQPEVIVNRI